MSVIERALDKLRRDATANGVDAAASNKPRLIGSLAGEAPRQELGAASAEQPPARRILIDRQAVRDAGYLPESEQDRQFADQYRQIKRPLITKAYTMGDQGGSPRLIMMASALPGDGKTFTSINLAFSMARERDTSVVLVDADIAKPHISRIFGLNNEPGLLDALADGSLDIRSLVLPTDVAGLSILPAGKQRDNATELLASARMAQLARSILEIDPRRIVLFDSAPLLVSSESSALAGSVGQIVLVVRAVHTPRQALLDALALLGDKKHVKLVLNQGRSSATHGYYGQGAYGSYEESPAD